MNFFIDLVLDLFAEAITGWLHSLRRKSPRTETPQSPEVTAAVRRHPSSGGLRRPLLTFIPRPRHGGGPHHPKRQR
ncbi:hypothetical protein ABZ883_04535 [Streptomyces sp. NPDC046977]|uniref:hypothetical protein n=1 Tax=Streptomyces sp. NPDC046977 TaxID=3154703 RepID=UPI0033D54840